MASSFFFKDENGEQSCARTSHTGANQARELTQFTASSRESMRAYAEEEVGCAIADSPVLTRVAVAPVDTCKQNTSLTQVA